ncbi:MAG: orotidine-5'-phosphate decarboxylase [Deltaproteobacteria bacterium]|nr:orotidine-5'-phosphate decarboxylase [Deltaproteobacteria bacterium]
MEVNADSVCIALDTNDLDHARSLVGILGPHVGWFKVGLTLFLAHGRDAVDAIKASGKSLFLDLKFNDIPAQVAGAVDRACDLGADLLTVHAGGGSAMLEAAASARKGGTRVVAVTVLTSLAGETWERMWPGLEPGEAVGRFTGLAVDSGVDGVVLSPEEVAVTRSRVPDDFMLVVPGIRPAGGETHDQARTGTPRQAYADGGSVLVIGRAITQADDPVAALNSML